MQPIISITLFGEYQALDQSRLFILKARIFIKHVFLPNICRNGHNVTEYCQMLANKIIYSCRSIEHCYFIPTYLSPIEYKGIFFDDRYRTWKHANCFAPPQVNVHTNTYIYFTWQIDNHGPDICFLLFGKRFLFKRCSRRDKTSHWTINFFFFFLF